MNKKDIILAAALIALSLILLAVFRINKDVGKYAAIYVDNELYERLPLDRDTELLVETERGRNKVVVLDGEVFVEEADCPDLICVRTGKKSREDEMIVCLPNKLVVVVER